MTDHADSLPTDLRECQQLLLAAYQQTVQLKQRAAQLERRATDSERRATDLEQRAIDSEQRIAQLDRVLDATAASYQELQHEHASMLEELDWYKRWAHGRRRERIVEADSQRHLFDLSGPDVPEAAPSALSAEPRQQIAGHSRRPPHPSRELDLSRLPHQRHELDVPDAEKICDCCQRTKDRIGEEITRILEYVPSKLQVHEHVRPKYACRYCKNGVSSPPPPDRPIARGIAGAGLIAQIVVSKFSDHLPLYRQEDILTRHGLHLSRSTLCDWVSAAAELFRPLYELQQRFMLQSAVLWTDDTPVTVLVGGDEGSQQGRFWTYIGDDEHPYSVYDFTMSRGRDGPQRFLKDFRGYLHADAYAGYDGIFLDPRSQIVEVACWAHARRKFFDARKSFPREVHQVLDWIGQLYDIEDRARPLTPAARRDRRVTEAVPVLDRLEAYLAQLASEMLPKSVLAKAVIYARNQWEALRCYTKDGRLTIDNNTSERTLRHQAIGRKNWLFLGSTDAGSRAAVLYTVLAGAKRHRIEPWAYVRELLLRLHAEDQRLEDMLPDRWATKHPECILTHRLAESRDKAATKRDRRARRRAQAGSR